MRVATGSTFSEIDVVGPVRHPPTVFEGIRTLTDIPVLDQIDDIMHEAEQLYKAVPAAARPYINEAEACLYGARVDIMDGESPQVLLKRAASYIEIARAVL